MQVKITQTVVIVAIILTLGYMAILISVATAPSSTTLRATIEASYQRRIEAVQSNLRETEAKLIVLLREKAEAAEAAERAAKTIKPAELIVKKSPEQQASRPGVIVLGMHRSGTSVLGGLVNKMGLSTGGPLIPAAEDNEKGFFERIDVVLQNDAFLESQHLHYAYNTYKYDHMEGLKYALEKRDERFFSEGRRGLKFLNAKENMPWMLKDPRLCITFRTWLPLLTAIPAVLFTYRHPLDVGLSMNKRETEHFMVGKGIRMWYVYNRMAVRQSHDLCRVVTSHRLVMKQPKVEMERIFNELVACGVPVPRRLSEADVTSFVDIKLQHGKTTLQDDSCGHDLSTAMPPSTWQTTDPNHITLYREALRVYCAMEDRSAFRSDFVWDDSIIDN